MDVVKPFIERILYPAMEKRNGNRIRQNIHELLNTQSLDPARIRQLQADKLKRLLIECIENVPAYKAYKNLKDVIDPDPFKALSRFPVLDKASFRKNSEAYINIKVSRASLIPNRTGGSTSEPVKFFMDRKTVEYYEAARWRGLSWWGISPGSRSVMIWGNPLELSQAEQKKFRIKEKWLKNRIIIPAYSLTPRLMPFYTNLIDHYRPEYIYGYASALYAFGELMAKQNLKLHIRMKAAVSTAETLHDFQRVKIQESFDCPVVNEYGARDGGILAFEAPCGSMHISAENAILEVLDAKTMEPLPAGRSGILLVTDLNNFSMPRLRYRLGDNAILSDRRCDCGRGLPVLEKIDGREDDMFVTADGKLIHGHAFNHISRSLNALKKFQIVQYSPTQASLSIVRNDASDQEEMEQFLQGVKNLLPGTSIEVQFVDDIPLSESGKFRYAVRKFDI